MAVKKKAPTVKAGAKLTLENLQKIDKKNDEMKLIKVNGYPIKINKVFRDTTLQVMIAEFASIQMKLKDLGVPVEEMDFTGIAFGLIFKHFSDLPVPDSIDGLMKYVQMLIDNQFFTEIVNEYDTEQINKVTNGMKNAVNNANFILENAESLNSGI